MSLAAEAYYAEIMTSTASSWHANSLQDSFDKTDGAVYCPVSGDAISLNRAPWKPSYSKRHQAIGSRAHSTDQLWDEDEL